MDNLDPNIFALRLIFSPHVGLDVEKRFHSNPNAAQVTSESVMIRFRILSLFVQNGGPASVGRKLPKYWSTAPISLRA